jgi:hypothetical protein
VAEVSKKALKATVASEAIAVFKKIKTVINISYYLHVKKSVTFITS